MISRIWHGWTIPSDADKYEMLLKEESFVGIQNRHIRGFKSIQLLRRNVGNEVEFVTIMLFDSLGAYAPPLTNMLSRALDHQAAKPRV